MKIPQNIKVKKFPWTLLPFLSQKTAQALYPNIYVPERIYKSLKSKNPVPKYAAVLIHEQTHIQRQKEIGPIKWYVRYCFSRKFRCNEEILAIKASFKYLKEKGVEFSTEKQARQLSGPMYLWCVNYDEAKKRLDVNSK